VKDACEQQRMREEADVFLDQVQDRYRVMALFLLSDAYSDGDDIVARCPADPATPAGQRPSAVRLPMLRQQESGSDCLCLADYIPPKSQRMQQHGQIGFFATSVEERMVTDFSDDPYAHMMAQLLADRLAEAAVERLHEYVRKTCWGYAADERLSIDEMLQGRYQGIRPAIGYPSLPDASLNFLLDQILQMSQIGIRLTETGAMRPHASVSGLMFSHPEARYFSVGTIGEDQLCDYARRRGMPVETVRTFLAGNL
jgi:cobalamin-dependent methionine synthase I